MIAGTMSSHVSRIVLDGALRLGVSPGETVHLPGLELTATPDDLTRVPTPSGVRLWELIARRGGTGAGLRVAESAAVGRLATWDFLITTGPTFAAGFRTAARYLPLIADPLVKMEVVQDDRLLTITYENEPFHPDIERALEEFAMALALRRARDFGGGSLRPVRVQFASAAPADHRSLTEHFGTDRVDFGARRTAITFLDPEPPDRQAAENPELARILRNYAELTLSAARPAPSWTERFRVAMGEALHDDQLTLEYVAHRLTTTPRTLQRRLGEQGTSWRAEVERVRHEQAVALLRDGELPIKTIASRLGYTDARALGRAFVRWTGQTPDAFRRSGVE